MAFSYYINGDFVQLRSGPAGLDVTVDGEKVAPEDLPLPTRVVAISSTINDKFPFADTDEDDFYRYCGVRETSNATWTATLSRRTIENLLNISLRDHQDSIVELFRYLGISTNIEITFRAKNGKELEELINHPDSMMSAVNAYARENTRMQVQMFRSFSIEDAQRVCDGLSMAKFTPRKYLVDVDLRNINADYSDVYYAINVLRRIGAITDVDLNVQKYDSTESYGFAHSSSGEAQLLYTFSSLIRHAKDNSLIFIDEPEISLHPTWQIRYVGLLKRALVSFPGCHVIIATHSHFIISDLEQDTSSLHVFEKKDDQLCIRNVEYSTYAWSADHILYDVFDVRSIGNLAFENDLAEALNLIANSTDDHLRLENLKAKFERLIFNESDPLKKVIDSITEFVDANH
ncbi:hypothetical protein KU43P_41290 [Pseudomonas sp. KU43P]|nr:hypothetical protein KU43P_41290 [Pseudomonas sp. KU43P]